MLPGMERLRAVGTDASRAAPAEAEVSSTAFQELILFIYQGDCDREMQRALNLERLDAVADIRTRRSSIDEALTQIVVRASAWICPYIGLCGLQTVFRPADNTLAAGAAAAHVVAS